MKFIPLPPWRGSIRSLLVAAILCTLAATVAAEPIQPGDTIKLIRKAPLLFREQPLRDGEEGETFSVLACRPEAGRVFVLLKGKDGKDIAASIPDDAVTVVAKASTKLRERAVAAAKAGRLEDATRLILEALKTSPKEPELLSLSRAVITIGAAKEAVEKAKKQQAHANGVAAAKRKNAAVADRPNPLAPNDTSNQRRAEVMREEAQAIESEAKAALAEAQSRYQAAMALLTPPSTGDQRRIEGPVAMSMDALMKDPPTNPNPFVARTPSFEETIDFINSKIKGHQQRIWFGKNSRKMLVSYESLGQILVVEPGKMVATVKIEVITNDAIGVAQAWVRMECVGGNDEAEVVMADGKRTKGNSFAVELDDPSDRDRVATACRHLLEISGAKKEAF